MSISGHCLVVIRSGTCCVFLLSVPCRLYEYQWPLFGSDKVWYMLQEQVAEYLDIRGMQRRYPGKPLPPRN